MSRVIKLKHKPWCNRFMAGLVDDEGNPIQTCFCGLHDPRDPTGANDRRDGKDRRAWDSPRSRAWMSWRGLRFSDRRQSDRRGGE